MKIQEVSKESKDERYHKAKILLENNVIQTVDQLYKVLPKNVIANGLGINPIRFSNNRSKHPGQFKLDELIRLSELIETDLMVLVNIFKYSIDKEKTSEN